MLNLTPSECDKMLKDLEFSKLKSETRLKSLKSDIAALSNMQKEIEDLLSLNHKKRGALRKALLLIRPLPIKITKKRALLLAKMELVNSKNITIATQQKLFKEIAEIKRDLEKECPHPFILDKQGYFGSASDDYDNRYPGERRCVVCGFREESYTTVEGGFLSNHRYIYKTLKPLPERIIEREPFHLKIHNYVFNIWVPLGAALHPFEKSVERDLNK